MSTIQASQSTLNGLKSRVIFCAWTGPEVMSPQRAGALWSIFKNSGRPVAFITPHTLDQWILPNHPLHEAYPYLSSTHKSDLLRCYLMHHYGGGYTDIKPTTTKWDSHFKNLEESNCLALGYPELEHGMPHLKGPVGEQIKRAHRDLIGLCAFIFKPNSSLTQAWYEEVKIILDNKLSELKSNPSRSPLDQAGLLHEDGTQSKYPLRWAEILGEVLHPLFFQNREKLLKAPINPQFHSYR
jgi:hypothetical protein